MPRLSLKPDASFFRKIATGAVGVQAVCRDLGHQGHDLVDLERGASETKMWKDVKRKRVRIPDLLCIRCGLRVECRAKTKPELSMSHSATEQERSWDYGMAPDDVVAFPICQVEREDTWARGRLDADQSYWHERVQLDWSAYTYINYFRVRDFRNTPHAKSATKGVEEASETSISWEAIFTTFDGTVESVNPRVKVTSTKRSGYSWGSKGFPVHVAAGDVVCQGQVLASPVPPLGAHDLQCSGGLPDNHIDRLLRSPMYSQRYTGIKLARLREDREPAVEARIRELVQDDDEDLYIRLEGVSYIVGVCGDSLAAEFDPYVMHNDPQIRLEAVITLSEVPTAEAVELLATLLRDEQADFYLRSAAAWSLGRIGVSESLDHLIAAFAGLDINVREEVLDAAVNVGQSAVQQLVSNVTNTNGDVAAGCAEAVRRLGLEDPELLDKLVTAAITENDRLWAVWLLGHLPPETVRVAGEVVEDEHPDVSFALNVLWAFGESWIARRWDLDARAAGMEL